MDFKAALRERLITAAPVTALQGTRTTWGTRPQNGALPATVLSLVYDPVPTDFGGTVATRDTAVQIDVWGESDKLVGDLAEAVIAALLPPASVGGIQFRRAFVEANRDAGEQAGNAFLHRRIIEMTFWHSTI